MKKKIMSILFFIVSLFTVGLAVYFVIILFGNYAIDEKDLVLNESTKIVDRDGNEITRLFVENREIVDLEDIPNHVKDAFISIEDHRFYEHTGIDIRAIARALYRDVITQSKAEGASTITQQLAKNAFLTNEKSWLRKTKEVLIAVNLEQRYSKDDILEMYLNRIYFGHGAHGVQAASKLYFDKDVKDTSIEEGALLASLIKAPSHYSPFLDPERSKERRDLVLRTMEQRGKLSAEETVRLQGKTIPTDQTKITENQAYLSYIDMVLEEAEEDHQISEAEILKGGYTIVVEMDKVAQEVLYEQFQKDETFPGSNVQGSMVLLDNGTGAVIAVQGGRDYVRKGFNRADQALRAPGSVFKPIAVYAPAMEEGLFNPYSLLKDEQINFDGYEPQNISGQYTGEITLYDAIKDSVNLPAVWALDQLGIDISKSYLEKQHLLLDDDGLGMALGGLDQGVSPLTIASLYRTLANNGVYSEPYLIDKIYDRNDEMVAEVVIEEAEVYSPKTAWDMTRMLEAVIQEGTGTSGQFNGALAGKTGTTSLDSVEGASRDIWFAGYTPDVSGAIWMGLDTDDEENYMTASSDVTTIAFKTVLQEMYPESSETNLAFEVPDGVEDLEGPIQFVDIDDLSANLKIGFTGGRVELSWSSSQDDRLHYRIYEVVGNDRKLIDEVVGESDYIVKGAGVFSSSSYVVVPFNPQIDREGEASNQADAEFQLFSRDSAS
ncbi:transglycosylase domain-containing protein [Salipaludibacillus sp. CF4.18]|uniref:transglycosylase domain-containing protein n=1 Tax=Salipaludibacillus sp. CF4.18 TaxID=3373081 RepID=UPI003EE4AE6A